MRVHGALWSVRAYICVLMFMVVVADFLLVGTSPGWVFAPLIIAGGVMVALRHPQILHNRLASAWLLLLIPLAGACVMDQSVLAPTISIMVLIVVSWWARGAHYGGAWRWWCAVLSAPFVLMKHVRSDHHLMKAWRIAHGARPFGIGIGVWIIPICLGVVFSCLFGVANPVIGQWFANLGTWLADRLDPQQILPTPTRILLWWCIAALVWLLLRTHPPRLSVKQSPIQKTEVDRKAVIVRSLIVVNVIFAIQVGMDLMYLAGGIHLPSGMTYATYAHRGAGPLFVAALISAALVLIAFRPGGTAERARRARNLVLIWLGQNVALTIAAIWRLWLYIDAYGLSSWRLSAAIWMMLVASALILIAVRIALAFNNRWLVDANALATLVTLIICSWVDVGGTVAWHNVRHCREVSGGGVPLDVEYLQQFGVEIGPAMNWLSIQSQDANLAKKAKEISIQKQREAQLLLLDWRAWTWIRARVAGNTNEERKMGKTSFNW